MLLFELDNLLKRNWVNLEGAPYASGLVRGLRMVAHNKEYNAM